MITTHRHTTVANAGKVEALMALFPAFRSALGGLGSVTRREILAGQPLLSWRVMSGDTIPFDHCLSARQMKSVQNMVHASVSGWQDLTTWLVAKCEERVARPIINRVLAQSKAPLKDADGVNATRWALHRELCATGLPVTTGSGGKTKWNRTRCCVPKTHILDAICVGEIAGVVSYPDRVIASPPGGVPMPGLGQTALDSHDSGSLGPRPSTDSTPATSPGPTSPPAIMQAPTSAEWPCARWEDSASPPAPGMSKGSTTVTAPSSCDPKAGDGRTNQKESSMPREVSTRSGSVVALLGALWGRISVAGQFR